MPDGFTQVILDAALTPIVGAKVLLIKQACLARSLKVDSTRSFCSLCALKNMELAKPVNETPSKASLSSIFFDTSPK